MAKEIYIFYKSLKYWVLTVKIQKYAFYKIYKIYKIDNQYII